MFFDECQSLDAAKELYRHLSKLLHPDRGGDKGYFIKMKTEYENFPSYNYKKSPNFGPNSSYLPCNKCSQYKAEADHYLSNLKIVEERLNSCYKQIKPLYDCLIKIKKTWWYKCFGRGLIGK